MYPRKIAAAGALLAGATFLTAAPSGAQDEPLEMMVSPTEVKQTQTVRISARESCPRTDGTAVPATVTITHDGEIVDQQEATTSGGWSVGFVVPQDAPAGSYTVDAVCQSGDTYTPTAFTVLAVPQGLTMAAEPASAAPGEPITVSGVDPCPNVGRSDREYATGAFAYHGPDGTDTPAPGYLLIAALVEDGTWIREITPESVDGDYAPGIYGVYMRCSTTDARRWPVDVHAIYEPIFVAVSEDGSATPVDPPNPPPTPPNLDDLQGLPDGGAPGTGETPPAAAVAGSPILTG